MEDGYGVIGVREAEGRVEGWCIICRELCAIHRTWSWLNMGVSGVVLEMRGLLSARSRHTMHTEVVIGLDHSLLQF